MSKLLAFAESPVFTIPACEPDNKGIKNVVLYVYTGRGGVKLPEMPPKNETHTWTIQGMRLDPHVLLSQAGDRIEMINKEVVGTNPNFNFFRNPAQNFTLAPNARKQVALKQAEPAPIPVEDNIFPWMRAYVIVLDHRFVAVSDEDGQLTIEGLPPGTLVFRLFHEAASGAIEAVTMNGDAQPMRRNNFTIPIHSGINDLGEVEIPAEEFNY